MIRLYLLLFVTTLAITISLIGVLEQKKGEYLLFEYYSELELLDFFDDPSKIEFKRNLIKAINSRANRLHFNEKVALAYSINQACLATGHDPYLLLAIVEIESSYNNKAISNKGAVGLMQLRPFVAFEVAKQNGLHWVVDNVASLEDTYASVMLGAFYLETLLEKFDDNLPLALAAYNQGPYRIKRKINAGTNLNSSRYTNKVVKTYKKIAEIANSI
ncbi:MAG: lytic transglycosylase domain-containing protein [Nitrospinota bacterium]